jgi:hypothetical protein
MSAERGHPVIVWIVYGCICVVAAAASFWVVNEREYKEDTEVSA